MPQEIWKDVNGYEHLYKISNYGKVYGYKNGNFIKPNLDDGYLVVRLNKDNERKTYRVHRLVAEMFTGTCPENNVVNHKDGNKQNNYIENLEYVTQSENALHTCHVLGRSNIKLNKEKALEIVNLYNSGVTVKEIISLFNISDAHVYRLINGNRWGKISGIKYNKKYTVTKVNKNIQNFIPEPLAENEKFVDIPEYKGLYKISDLGRVFNVRSGQFMKMFYHNGYPAVMLTKNKKQKRQRIHVLLMKIFVGDPPEGYVINHKDHDRSNNNLSNLEYVSRSTNALNATLEYENFKLNKEQILDIVNLCNGGISQSEVGKKFNSTQKYISKIMCGQIWSSITGIQKKKESDNEINLAQNNI